MWIITYANSTEFLFNPFNCKKCYTNGMYNYYLI